MPDLGVDGCSSRIALAHETGVHPAILTLRPMRILKKAAKANKRSKAENRTNLQKHDLVKVNSEQGLSRAAQLHRH